MPSRFSRRLRAAGPRSQPSSWSSGTRRWRSPPSSLGAADYVVKAADSFRALFFKLDRVSPSAPLEERAKPNLEDVSGRERLERQLRDALATASETQRSFNTAAEHFRQTQARLQATIDQERASREALEAKLADADASRQNAQPLAAAMTTGVAERSERHAQDATRLAESAAARAALEQRVAELEAELERADQPTCARSDGGRRAAGSGQRRVQSRAGKRDPIARRAHASVARSDGSARRVPARSRGGISRRRRAPRAA